MAIQLSYGSVDRFYTVEIAMCGSSVDNNPQAMTVINANTVLHAMR